MMRRLRLQRMLHLQQHLLLMLQPMLQMWLRLMQM
jgi:hypothetical protein